MGVDCSKFGHHTKEGNLKKNLDIFGHKGKGEGESKNTPKNSTSFMNDALPL